MGKKQKKKGTKAKGIPRPRPPRDASATPIQSPDSPRADRRARTTNPDPALVLDANPCAGPRASAPPRDDSKPHPHPDLRRGPCTGPRGLRAPRDDPQPWGAPSAPTAVPPASDPPARLPDEPEAVIADDTFEAYLEERRATRLETPSSRSGRATRLETPSSNPRSRRRVAARRTPRPERISPRPERRMPRPAPRRRRRRRSNRAATTNATRRRRLHRAAAAEAARRTPPSNAPSPRRLTPSSHARMLASAVLCDKKQARSRARRRRRRMRRREEGTTRRRRRHRERRAIRRVVRRGGAAAAAEDGRSMEDVIAEAMEAIKISLDPRRRNDGNTGTDGRPRGWVRGRVGRDREPPPRRREGRGWARGRVSVVRRARPRLRVVGRRRTGAIPRRWTRRSFEGARAIASVRA